MNKSTDTVLMFLNGTAMSGFRDHIHVRDARFIGTCRTAARYRFYAVRNEYPGLVEVTNDGVAIVGELYEMDQRVFHEDLLPNEPPELRPGKVELEDGTLSNVMLLDLNLVPAGDKIVDIASFGGWRAYVHHLSGTPTT